MRTGKNHEGYSDPTASCAVGHLTHEEKQREKKRKEEKKRDKSSVIKAVCWGVLILILLAVAALALYIVGMTLYFNYQLKDGRTRREYTEKQKRADEEQIQAIREMQARKEEKRQKRRQRKSEANRR